MKKNRNNAVRKTPPNGNHSGWSEEEEDEDSSRNASNMSKTTSDPQSPQFQKQIRLSRILDRLTEQLLTNNNYPQQPVPQPQEEQPILQIPQYPQFDWTSVIPILSVPSRPVERGVPLDLSMKSQSFPTPSNKPVYTCVECSQTFSLHDRLTKHMASRHKNRTLDSARNYECKTCKRKFARSDMLTRHERLHTGVKPYACDICGQVFSRSDHLTTHQRTHTGEKPYHCPACSYAACRRDMITRHLRTHSRRMLET